MAILSNISKPQYSYSNSNSTSSGVGGGLLTNALKTATTPNQPTSFKLTPGNMVGVNQFPAPGNSNSTPQFAPPPMGSTAKAPTPTAPSNSLPSGQTSGPTGGAIDYTLHNGESVNAYQARIAAARGTQNNTQNPTQTNQVAGTSTTVPPATPIPTQQQAPDTNPYTATAPTYNGLIGSLAGTASQPSPGFLNAQMQAQKALADLQTSRTNQADALSLNAQTPIPLEFQQGRGQILNNQYLQQQNAYANTYAGATAQMGAATSQQSTQQSGLNQAAGLSAPQGANAMGTFNPATGQYSPYGGGQGGGVGSAGQVLGNLSLSQNYYSTLVPAFTQAQSVYNGLNSFISSNPNINPSDSNYLNSINAWARGEQVSDPKYNQLTQYLNEFLQTLTPIVGSQGVSDYKSKLVQTMVNPTSSTSSIQAQVKSLMEIARGKLNATYQSFTNPSSGSIQEAPPQNTQSTTTGTNIFSW